MYSANFRFQLELFFFNILVLKSEPGVFISINTSIATITTKIIIIVSVYHHLEESGVSVGAAGLFAEKQLSGEIHSHHLRGGR